MSGTLKVVAQGDREIVMTRVLDAPRKLVFDAFTKPELLKKWFYGMEGWTLAVCEMDLRVGGKYRWVWKKGPGASSDCGDMTEMGMGGVYREIKAPDRLVMSGKFDQPWYPGEEVSTMVFTEKGGKTTVTQTVKYDSREARDAVLASGATEGVELGYGRLEKMLKELE
jgi:uncharacterized protein YndB with AHSA1/START domain